MVATTKERILEAAEEIMLAKSFHSVGLSEILGAVKVPKGSFYHHFSSKEQFGVELLTHYVAAHTERLRKHFETSGESGLQKLVDFWAYQVGCASEADCKQCCLVVKLGLEVGSFSKPMRDVMAAGLKTWRRLFEKVVREGQADGSIRRDVDPAEAAAAIQDTWQGAMQRMQVERNVTPLRSAARFLRGTLATR